jgi:hypothetical protein
MTETLPTLGHNLPPPDLLIGETLREKLAEDHAKLIYRRDELLAAAVRIPDVTDEDIARRVSDFIKQVTAAAKAAEGARVSEKEPYLAGTRTVDGFFKAISDPLDLVKRGIEKKLTLYLREKAEQERRERMERERLAREEEERRRREAAEAERKLADERTLNEAIEAQARAEQAAAEAIKAEKEATAKAAEMSRIRGEYGAVSSLRTTWTFSDLSRAELDLEALRAHIPLDGLERAVRSFIKAGGRQLKGCNIFETTDAVVR